jgi:hypothetical protein
MRINKKERQVALRSALTDRAREGKLIVIELPEFEEPETAKAVQLLKEWEVTGKILLVVSAADEEAQDKAWLSFRNLPHVLTVTYPTAYTVLAADTVIFTRSALDELTTAATARSKKAATASGDSAAPATASGSGSRSAPEQTRKAPSEAPASSEPSAAPATAKGSGSSSAPESTRTAPDAVPQSSPTPVTLDGPDTAKSSDPATPPEGTAGSGAAQVTDTADSGGTDSRAARTPQSTGMEPEPEPVPESAGTAPPEPESGPGTDEGERT